jgi:hypothetical protein
VQQSAVFLSVPVAIFAHSELATGKPVQTKGLCFIIAMDRVCIGYQYAKTVD